MRRSIALLAAICCLPYCAPPVLAQRAQEKHAAQPMPHNGRVWRTGGGAATARFVIETTGQANYLVRLYEKSNKRLVMTVMVHGGKTVDTKAPYGTYTLRYAVGGAQWFGFTELFGPSTDVYEANATLRFYRSGNTIHGQRVTLYGVVGGNMPTSKIDKRNF